MSENEASQPPGSHPLSSGDLMSETASGELAPLCAVAATRPRFSSQRCPERHNSPFKRQPTDCIPSAKRTNLTWRVTIDRRRIPIGGQMSDTPLSEVQEPDPDPEVVAHIEGEEGEEEPCTLQQSCGIHW